MNLIDKAIATISPEKALKRIYARKKLDILNSGYSHHGASRRKKSLLGWISSGGSPDEDIGDNLDILRERTRDLFMGAPMATGALKTMRTNVVGSGLRLKPQIDAEFLGLSEEESFKLEKDIEREFSLWADSINCDVQRMNNFYELQQLAFLSWLMSGDVFTLLPHNKIANMPYDLRIYLIEADRVRNPEYSDTKNKDIKNGVEIGQYGQVLAYWFSKEHPGSYQYKLQNNKYTRVEAFGKNTGRQNVLHLMESERPGQRRGIPILAPVIESLKQLSRYTEAELMAAVVSGMYTVFIETKDEVTDDVPMGSGVPLEDQVDYEDETSYELGNGAILALAEGQTVKEANPGRPNTAFDGFVTAISRQIGAALEIPYELLVKQFTASYSASRASLLEAWKMFRMRRSWLAADFCQPIYEEWFAEGVAKGRIHAPGFFNDPVVRKAYSSAEWYGPSQGQIDPLKEVKAAKERVSGGFSTRAKETAELTGTDFNDNYRQLVREEKLMKDLEMTGTSTNNNGDDNKKIDDEDED